MLSQTFAMRSAALAVGLAAIAAACASAPPRSQAQTASITDPRVVCAKAELFKLGYEVDESFRRPGRLIATRTFPIVRNHRAAISAEVDSVDKTFEVWARVLPRDNGITLADLRAQPPVGMLGDAMQVQQTCDEAK